MNPTHILVTSKMKRYSRSAFFEVTARNPFASNSGKRSMSLGGDFAREQAERSEQLARQEAKWGSLLSN
jgi:hypothetical protein